MNKPELFEELSRWRVVDASHKLSEEMAREIMGLIQKKKAEEKFLAIAKNSSGIVPLKSAEGKIRKLRFNLITTEGQIKQFFINNMPTNPTDCLHPAILIAQEPNRKILHCLMCGYRWR